MNILHILIALLFCLIVALLVWLLLRLQRREQSQADSDEALVEVAIEAPEEVATPQMAQSEGMCRLNSSIEGWALKRRYTDPMLTIGTALSEMGVTGTELTLYLQLVHNLPGYRQWIAKLRIEEAKRLMIEHPNYTFDAIASLCGMSNGSALARAFKTQTGLTPSDWVAHHRPKKGKLLR